MILQQLNEAGHFTPHFAFLYLFIKTLYEKSATFAFMAIMCLIDYTLVGPKFKNIAHQLKLSSPRPAYPKLNGMPSGHTQLTWLLFVFFKLQNDKFHSFLFGCLALFTAFQRIYSGMHSPLQVFIGLILGIILGHLWHKLYTYII